MTLESIYYIGQTVAVVVIVLTLLAILYQGYQTNKIARADLTLNMWMQAGAAHYSFVDTPEKADFMHRALNDGGSLTDPEKLRFANLLGYAIGAHEAAFMLHNRNLVEGAAYDRSEGLSRMYLQSRRVRKWWRIRREYKYDPRFRALIDAMADEFENVEHPQPEPRS
ncbi:MAG: hypothetical protein WAU39_20235 [Polyangiales bacterium]